ncbi:MAG TPA: ribosome biogenesis GTP-binding protein YihA/YsxC [Candidatus Polarisedimenticolia bacterium]|nr:ribosome biogenesis GTP-binding protein YihA/YsxC [Candidatus Polarisedimenticolia bacterium]
MLIRETELFASASSPDRFPRDGAPQIAFMGRSNVGKSSLINRLLGRKGLARTSKTPGRTRALHFFLVNGRCYFVDLPGYGYAKVPRPMREEWKGFVESYLEGRGPDLAVVLTDARRPPTPLDRELVDWLRAAGVPHTVVLTKADKLSRRELLPASRQAGAALGLPSDLPPLPVSAVSGDGVPALWRTIDDACSRRRSPEPVPSSDDDGASHRPNPRHQALTTPEIPASRRMRP